MTELHASDLRFTPDEAAAFLNQGMGLSLTAADLAALEARTEGWVAGLQLAALAMRDHQDRSGDWHDLEELVAIRARFICAQRLDQCWLSDMFYPASWYGSGV